MNKEIINVLEENKIYDDYYNEIEIYNEKEFLFHYKFNNTHIHKIPSSIKRNKDGLLKLDDEPFIKNIYKSNGHNTAYWILFDNGSKVLLKEVDYGETCMELLFMELAKAINIPSAKYDVAILNGKTYLASVCFTGVDDLIFDYYDVENKQDIFIEDLIKKAKNINQENFVKKTLTIDLLTNHQDRFPHNFAVILRNRKELICPLFDNGLCGLYRKKFYTLPSYKHSILPKDIMSFLLEDEKVKDWCLKKVLKQDVRNYRENIMKEKGLFIDENMNDLFTENVENGKQMIANIIKK